MAKKAVNQVAESPQIRVAKKEQFTVPEVAELLARAAGCSANAARVRIYRAIDDGRLRSNRYLGSLRVPRAEVCRILQVEEYSCGV